MKTVIVGGGIIGLSIAFELAKRKHEVVLVEKNQIGQQASWAGAGIMVPANASTAIHPMEHLEAASHVLHEQWSRELEDLTGIDNGFRKCGGLYIAFTAGEIASLTGLMMEWDERGIEYQEMELGDCTQEFMRGYSKLAMTAMNAIFVPGESQFSNPHQLQALEKACQKLGVQLITKCGEVSLKNSDGNISMDTSDGPAFSSEWNIVLASGAWTEKLASMLGIHLPIQPVRGQMVLYKLDPDQHSDIASGPIVNEGTRYLVPREDGHVLAGSTIEEVGFDCQTTAEGLEDIRAWAKRISPHFNDQTFKKSWAGLRPGTYDGFPYLGKFADCENAFVATGHFKSGLHLSTATAVTMADMIEGKAPQIDVSPLSPNRVVDHRSTESK